jgi:ABC-type multidrug transport system ATPase subunit
MDILETDSVELSYGQKQVIAGGYMKLESGRIHALVGRNGFGKSSLMRVVFGSLTPQFRFTRYNGNPLPYPFKKPGLIRYLPQFDFVPRRLKISSFLKLYDVPWHKIVACFPEFEGCEKMKLGALSGGQIRMVTSLAVILSPVKFVLLDEPFTHVMPLHVDVLKSLIQQEAAAGKGFLITDHMYDHVLDLADSFYYMEWLVTRPISREELLEKDYFLRMK